jgi:hypothetical protein
VLLGLAAGFLPLFGGPGYELSLALGLLLPAPTGALVALYTFARRRPPVAALLAGVRIGLALALIELGIAWLHLLHVPRCEPVAGSLHYALTSGAGIVLAAAWGATLGGSGGRSRNRLLVAACGALPPLLCIGIGLYRFVSSPMIFAYDPFVGFFSGSLYDTVIETGGLLYTYRAGTLLTFAALFATAALRLPTWRVGVQRKPAVMLLAVTLWCASIVHAASGTTFGHYHTPTSIARALGGELRGARCLVRYPQSMRPEEAALLLRDCEENLQEVERVLGARGPETVQAYFFRDPEQKRTLMGAAHTYIAKPWRHEVYLQVAPYPHPVLAHELAHVVAGSFGQGPLHVSGGLRGMLPNPGLIEGIAVSAAPEADDLSEAQWARGMRELGILPKVRNVFSLAFLSGASSTSYTVAGAFVVYIRATYGAEKVRAWYSGQDIEVLTAKSWDTLEADFDAYLTSVPFPAAAGDVAKARFDRPSVFGRRCPHWFDRVRGEADGCRERGEYAAAGDLYSKLLAAEPRDPGTRLATISLALRLGDYRGASVRAAEFAVAPQTSGVIRDRALELSADALVLDGNRKAAAATYRALASSAYDEDFGRQCEVKAQVFAAETASPALAAAARTLLLGAGPGRGADVTLGLVELAPLDAHGDTPLASYLLGRNLLLRGDAARAAAPLQRALMAVETQASGFVGQLRLQRETLRLAATLACILHDAALAARVTAQLGPAGPYAGTAGGRREAVAALLARCHP